MYNFNNLSDFEFEILCKDIMQKELDIELHTFQKGRDGGIDITDDPVKKNIIIQVKHYINSKYSSLIASLKKEVEKIQALQPKRYYVCCAVNLTPNNKKEIYDLFSDYMESANDIKSLQDINDFLDNSENRDIVRKHYKLWLESTNILGEIMNQSIFIDCESLLYNIGESSKEFVATNCYYECLDILNKKEMLLLLGAPGTGKTVTTKMLALYYVSKGYQIRYTTNGDIRDLKNALSAHKDSKEVVLLDDCLGQHYFKMKETQENELLGLVKYIAMNKNKMLIMNSRVTIFQQAKEQSIEFKQFADDKKIKIKTLDMSQISILDKGKIFYNHIYFKGLPLDYYQDIRRNYNYRKIVMHSNYTPRIMEFVTREVNYISVPNERYFEFVMKCLDNPREIWHDEFTEKLQQEDRILLTTLYSLTDTSVSEESLKRAYNYRLRNTMTIDTSINMWEIVLKRLEGAFIIFIEKNEKKEIGVINPSVNDFLKDYLQKNDIERKCIQDNAIEYEQIKRGFASEMDDIIRVGKADLFHYSSPEERMFVILSYICRLGVLNNNYKCVVNDFFELLPHGWFDGMMNKCEIFVTLLSQKFNEFYGTYGKINNSKLMELFTQMSLNDYKIFITSAKKYKISFFYTEYRDIFIEALNNVILEFIEDVYPDDYCNFYNMKSLVEQSMDFNGFGIEMDRIWLVNIICEWVKDDVENEISQVIMDLPHNIRRSINISRDNIYIDEREIDDCIERYLGPTDYEDDVYECDDNKGANELDVLDCIFK